MTPIEKREDILKQAIDIVCSDRNNQYGEPEDNFSVIGELWSAYLTAKCASTGVTVKIGAQEAADMLILFKVARSATATTPKLDTYVDIAGYAACAGAFEHDKPNKEPASDYPRKCFDVCRKCHWRPNLFCNSFTCSNCIMRNEEGKCKCSLIKTGEPCPHFTELTPD